MKPCTWVLLIGLTSGWLSGCSKSPAARDRSPSRPAVKWPARPTDGSPVALSFAAMAYKGDHLGAELRVFSFSNRAISALRLTFHFLDKTGAPLGRLAYPTQGEPLVKPGAWVTLAIKARMPRQTDKVTVTLQTVVFTDGRSWTRPTRKKD